MFKKIVLLSCLATVAMATSGKLRTEDHTRLTGEQRAALDELMRRVLPKIKEDWVKDELYVLKFLRAKNFNVDDAELFFLAHLSWRDDNKMKSILTEDFSDMKKNFPYKLDGYDKQGRPLLIMDFGDWDLDGAAERGEIDRVLRYYDRMLEEAEQKVLDLQHQGKILHNSPGS
ncbi:Protein real-time [Folsomia candida]|uniref:Protein real-time n=1 Tax=Folsomia candida TaxID=158441 RepID=A0A226D1J7_FOLCA|nr:Protein real-time [Folsomia candida]